VSDDPKINYCDEPPICNICDRSVIETFIKAIGPTKEHPYCKDCFFAWYDGVGLTKELIKKDVRKKHGRKGGEAKGVPQPSIFKFSKRNKK
jgi:hypothetical protein